MPSHHTAPAARRVPPGFTERVSAAERGTDPYAPLLRERIVVLGTRIDETSANDVIAQLIRLESAAPHRDIWLYVNSPGGSFTAMTAIHDTMRFVTPDVATCCIGQATAAAAVLLAAGAPGKRMVTPGARIVLDQPRLAEPARGRTADLDIRARELIRQREQLALMLARYSGQDVERVQADIERESVWDAAGAINYGLADRLAPGRERTAAFRPAGR